MQNSAPGSEKAMLKAQVTSEKQSSQQDQHSTGTPGDVIVREASPEDEFAGVDVPNLDSSQCYATSAMDSCTEDQTDKFDDQTTISVDVSDYYAIV
jgi:hypothetical protein